MTRVRRACAVLGIVGERDARVDAGREKPAAAPTAAEPAAAATHRRVLDWHTTDPTSENRPFPPLREVVRRRSRTRLLACGGGH